MSATSSDGPDMYSIAGIPNGGLETQMKVTIVNTTYLWPSVLEYSDCYLDALSPAHAKCAKQRAYDREEILLI